MDLKRTVARAMMEALRRKQMGGVAPVAPPQMPPQPSGGLMGGSPMGGQGMPQMGGMPGSQPVLRPPTLPVPVLPKITKKVKTPKLKKPRKIKV